MDRRERLLSGLDLRRHVGLEIGALCRPFLSRNDGEVIFVDHADTPTLRKKYSNDPGVDLGKLVEVDAVWGANTLKEALKGRCVDYIVASHVIEHVPDLIGWLGELASVLREGGEVRLIVPDKRFTFDYLRRETQLTDALYSFLIHARHPQPHVVLEYVMNVTKIDTAMAWRHEIDEDAIEFHHTIDHAMHVARDVIDNGAYHDVHCWVFTPKSFASLFRQLAVRDFINFKCTRFHSTEINQLEFFVTLQASENREEVIESWRAAEASLPDTDFAPPDPELELARAKAAQLDEHNARLQELARLNANELGQLRARVAQLEAERNKAERHLEAMGNSTSWKMTEPLRQIKRALKRT
jgi:predicted SAM-dependent methyltransferase